MASETEEQTVETRLGFQEVMAAIATCLATRTNKIEAVQLDVDLIRQDMDKVCLMVSEVEQRVGQTEDTVLEHSASLRTLQARVHMEYKVDDAENRNRRNNLWIVGLPEGVVGKKIRRCLWKNY